jgi:iron complex outermembrane receptor protein
MKKFLGMVFILFQIISTTSWAQGVVKGRVQDAKTGENIAGATLSIPDLRLSTSSNSKGEFILSNTPARGLFLIEVRYIGYKTSTQSIDFANTGVLVFKLGQSSIEAHEVVITGSTSSADNRKNSASISLVEREKLLNQSTNIIDALSKIPGVSQITTGGGVSKPVIRGLGYNRVITLADGAKQEGQQWGDEHGVEIDQFNVDKVEVLKGAASLLYGSDALGGVINMVDPLPAPEGQIKGEVLSNFSSNGALFGNSAMIFGNKNGFVWRTRISLKSAKGYETPIERIPNTGFNEQNLSGQMGVNKNWGYAHLNVSNFTGNVGLPDFLPNANGEFEDASGNILTQSQINGRTLLLPNQAINHKKVSINSNVLLGSGRIRANITYQKNQRKEFEGSQTEPGLFFKLNTLSSDFKYYFSDKNGLERVLGLSAVNQTNTNKGQEFLVPNYSSNEWGVFGYIKKNWETTSVNVGLRLDQKTTKSAELIENGNTIFNTFENTFGNISGALGFTQEFGELWNIKANVGSAFRAPNIAELSANGVHEGAFRYEIGSNALKPERSLYADLGLGFHTEKIDVDWAVFYNQINRYIYARQSGGETITNNGTVLPVYRFGQDNALLTGTEFSITLHPINVLHIESSFAYTRASNKTTGRALPFIPPGVVRNDFRLEPRIKGLKNSYLSMGLEHVFAQKRIDIFETSTGAYTLLNAGIGTSVLINKLPLKIHVAGNNLLNKKYYDHLSRLKPGRLDETNLGLGFYNPGRNITVGIYLPFSIK